MLFKPFEQISKSIPQSFQKLSQDKNIDIKDIDFELLSYETFIKRENDEEYQAIQNTDEITLNDIANEETYISQEYSIKIKPKVASKNDLQISLAADKYKTKAQLTIKAGSVFLKELHSVKSLQRGIWKHKLKAGMLIGVFEENLEKKLQKLLRSVPYDKPIQKDITFIVAGAKTPIPPVDSKLEKIYEEKQSDGIVSGVKEGELIAIYTPEKYGVNGRSCSGKFIMPRKPKIIDPKPAIDETLTIKRDKNQIKYYANINGYVVFANNTLAISQDLKLHGASFKTASNIHAKEADNDISVHIAHQKCYTEDAIGSGVNVEVKNLNVDGSVASNVNITTENLNIDAQTHKNSKMEVAQTAKIKLHRGDLKTKEAVIEILESGKIEASESAKIGKTLGGTIIAPEVEIEEMMSNTTVIASRFIRIRSITGENNTLIIDPDSMDAYHNEIEEIKEKIANKKEKLEKEKKSLQEKIKEHASQIDRIKTFKKRILKATQEGKTPMKQDVIRVKQYKKDSEKLQVQKSEIENNTMVEALEERLNAICTIDLQAKIKSNTYYDGHTKVIFINPDTREELSFIPEGKNPIIKLSLDEENNRIISVEEE